MGPKLGWSGQFHDLESVAMTPITSPKMMDLPENVMIERLSAISGYVVAFNNAFHEAQIDRLLSPSIHRSKDAEVGKMERSYVARACSIWRRNQQIRTARV